VALLPVERKASMNGIARSVVVQCNVANSAFHIKKRSFSRALSAEPTGLAGDNLPDKFE